MSNIVKIVYKMTSKTKATMENAISDLNDIQQFIDRQMAFVQQHYGKETYRKSLNKVIRNLELQKTRLETICNLAADDQDEECRRARDVLSYIYKRLAQLQQVQSSRTTLPLVMPRESQPVPHKPQKQRISQMDAQHAPADDEEPRSRSRRRRRRTAVRSRAQTENVQSGLELHFM